jgi:hypothetical protein
LVSENGERLAPDTREHFDPRFSYTGMRILRWVVSRCQEWV